MIMLANLIPGQRRNLTRTLLAPSISMDYQGERLAERVKRLQINHGRREMKVIGCITNLEQRLAWMTYESTVQQHRHSTYYSHTV